MSEITKYITKKNGKKVGMLIATAFREDSFGVGYSLCNTKLDKFDKQRAVQIAFGRAYKNANGDALEIPQSIRDEYALFYCRATKYFKDAAGGPIVVDYLP